MVEKILEEEVILRKQNFGAEYYLIDRGGSSPPFSQVEIDFIKAVRELGYTENDKIKYTIKIPSKK